MGMMHMQALGYQRAGAFWFLSISSPFPLGGCLCFTELSFMPGVAVFIIQWMPPQQCWVTECPWSRRPCWGYLASTPEPGTFAHFVPKALLLALSPYYIFHYIFSQLNPPLSFSQLAKGVKVTFSRLCITWQAGLGSEMWLLRSS